MWSGTASECSLWKPPPTWPRPPGGNAVGVYPRLHSHQPRCSWRPATPDGPAPPAELQTAASRCLGPGAAGLHHPGGPPGPWRGPCWCVVLGLPGCVCLPWGDETFKGLRGGFLINHLASCVTQGRASPGAHPGREAPHHQCRGEGSGCPLPRSGASVNTPASATSAAPPPSGQSASCTSVPPARFPQRAKAAAVSASLQPDLDVRCLVPAPRPRTEDARGSSFWGLTRHQGRRLTPAWRSHHGPGPRQVQQGGSAR